ncbi:diphthine methyltransferase [Ditylenchus destructor]|nr:diphthine methyltransferase [Ditylenchus destructor]
MHSTFLASLTLNESPAFVKYISGGCHDLPSSSEDATLLVSTYQLNHETQNDSLCDDSRIGSFFFLLPESNEPKLGNEARLNLSSLKVIQQLSTNGGVFRFETADHSKIIAALTSGCIGMIDLPSQTNNFEASQETSSCVTDENVMLLSVAWNSHSKRILCSDNRGHLIVVDSEIFGLEQKWTAHSHKYMQAECEVWNCCWLCDNNPNLCASGADDGVLKVWDVRDFSTHKNQPHMLNKSHNSGVTFVRQLPGDANFLITGSYDDCMRIFDLRNISSPVNELKVNGGVWHVEQMDDSNFLLAACMYGGWNVVERDPVSKNLRLIHTNTDCDQLLYGASSRKIKTGIYRIGLCTFNDKTVYEYEFTTFE